MKVLEALKRRVAERMSICRECDQYLEGTKRCRDCGCFLPAKAAVISLHCPIGKW